MSMKVLGTLYKWGLLDYKTEKYVLTRNRRVGALQRVLQLGIFGYVIGWSLLFKKGYQEKESDPQVSVITKLKGVSVSQIEALGSRLWDVADYTKPPQGENVFFLVTNFLSTPEQVQGTCPEHPSVPLAPCLADVDCPAGEMLSHSHGMKTGKCIMFNSTYQTCEIWGWCPVENGSVSRKPQLLQSENFTLFIKNSITFPKFNFFKTNTLETWDSAYFKGCRYDALSSPFCPVFRVGDVVEAAGGDFEDLALLEKGYNFRTATHWWKRPGMEARSLFKLFGIRFEILVAGQAGKFSAISTGITLGTGMALLGVVTFLCDLLLLYVDGEAPFYWGNKYEEAKAPKTRVQPEPASAPGDHKEPGGAQSQSIPVMDSDLTAGKHGLDAGHGLA